MFNTHVCICVVIPEAFGQYLFALIASKLTGQNDPQPPSVKFGQQSSQKIDRTEKKILDKENDSKQPHEKEQFIFAFKNGGGAIWCNTIRISDNIGGILYS